MEQVLAQIRKINQIFQKSDANSFSYGKICEILGDIMKSNFYIVLADGVVLGDYYTHREDSSAVYDPATGTSKFRKEENQVLLEIEETWANFPPEAVKRIFESAKGKPNKFHMFIPVYGGGKRLGTLVIARYEAQYEISDIILGEHVSTVVGVEIERRKNSEQKELEQESVAARIALEALSFTELIAVKEILKEINGREGVVVGSKIADQAHITRSIVVNSLKKLESSGVIESRSLGAKGTKIRINNEHLISELIKVKL